MKRTKRNTMYINLLTGEVYFAKNLRQAIKYHKEDAGIWGYTPNAEMVISYEAYKCAVGLK